MGSELTKKFDSRDVDFWVGVKPEDMMPIYRDYWETFTREVLSPGRKRGHELWAERDLRNEPGASEG